MQWERKSRTRGLNISYCMAFHGLNFGIDEIQTIMRNLYIDRLSRQELVNNLAGGGAAMTIT